MSLFMASDISEVTDGVRCAPWGSPGGVGGAQEARGRATRSVAVGHGYGGGGAATKGWRRTRG